jgi:hypothetical protein
VEATLLAKKTSGYFIDSPGSMRAAKWTHASKPPSERINSSSPHSPSTNVAPTGTFCRASGTQVVEGDDLVALREEQLGGRRPNETSGARDENSHYSSRSLGRLASFGDRLGADRSSTE